MNRWTEFWGNFTTRGLFYSSIATHRGERANVEGQAFKMTNTLMQSRPYIHLNQCEEFFGNLKDKLKKPFIGN